MSEWISFTLNGEIRKIEITPNTTLFNMLRSLGIHSVKCGCESTVCGLCTVFLEDKPVLSCSVPAFRVNGKSVTTLEGLQEEAAAFTAFIAREGADQCGFCNPGYIMNFIALLRENPTPSDDEIRAYLAGNLCRCSGYEGQLRGIRSFLDTRNASAETEDQ